MEYVPDHLVDPSILEILDEEGERVLGERDQGGFMGNFARAFFTPEEDGTHYLAIGAGPQDRGATGHYTLSVRVDDHADDYSPDPDVALRPGDSITARIDSDVAPDHPGLNPWDWAVTDGGVSIPIFGVESLDDRDVFRLEISEEGAYRVAVSDGPAGVGIWSLFDDNQNLFIGRDTAPVEEFVHTYASRRLLPRDRDSIRERGQRRRLYGLFEPDCGGSVSRRFHYSGVGRRLFRRRLS